MSAVNGPCRQSGDGVLFKRPSHVEETEGEIVRKGHNGTVEGAYVWFVNNSAAAQADHDLDEGAHQDVERLKRLQKNNSAFLIWLFGA